MSASSCRLSMWTTVVVLAVFFTFELVIDPVVDLVGSALQDLFRFEPTC